MKILLVALIAVGLTSHLVSDSLTTFSETARLRSEDLIQDITST